MCESKAGDATDLAYLGNHEKTMELRSASGAARYLRWLHMPEKSGEDEPVRIILYALVGLIGGFVVGIVLSHAFAVIGMQFMRRPIVIYDLPVWCALLGAIIVPLRLHRSSQ